MRRINITYLIIVLFPVLLLAQKSQEISIIKKQKGEHRMIIKYPDGSVETLIDYGREVNVVDCKFLNSNEVIYLTAEKLGVAYGHLKRNDGKWRHHGLINGFIYGFPSERTIHFNNMNAYKGPMNASEAIWHLNGVEDVSCEFNGELRRIDFERKRFLSNAESFEEYFEKYGMPEGFEFIDGKLIRKISSDE